MLYLVSTPIGNLGDISERARQVLETVDLVACEDTRTSGQLFTLLGIRVAALTPYHEHNADSARPKLIEKMKHGVNIALVSDAGTPLISDPGYKLVRDCYEAGVPVTTVPGANAVLSALQLSGLPSNAFYFAGFLPSKSGGRRQALTALKQVSATLIIYETPNRLEEALGDILEILGDRLMAVVREITKKFEEVRRGTKKFEEVRRGKVSELIAHYQGEGAPKGELVLVIDRAADTSDWTDEALDALIQETLASQSARDTVDKVSRLTGLPRKQIYKRVLAVQDGNRQ